MNIWICILILFLMLAGVYTVFDLVWFYRWSARFIRSPFRIILEAIIMIGLPITFLGLFDWGLENECCTESATFSPDHRVTIYTWIGLAILAYFLSVYRTSIYPPIAELILNAVLLIGATLNILIAIHIQLPFLYIANIPIGILLLTICLKNHRMIQKEYNTIRQTQSESMYQLIFEILNSHALVKYPILYVLCIPLIVVVSAILLIFGQRVDSIIASFTETYKHGFSQINHLCDNVHCGGHYLCSVAANGNRKWVKPIRWGIRHGGLILCNRQLLVANAFEDWVYQLHPSSHKIIRKQYDKIGDLIKKDGHLFEKKWICNLIYLLMKPLEWIFLLCLYTFVRRPENLIHSQYIAAKDRLAIRQKNGL